MQNYMHQLHPSSPTASFSMQTPSQISLTLHRTMMNKLKTGALGSPQNGKDKLCHPDGYLISISYSLTVKNSWKCQNNIS